MAERYKAKPVSVTVGQKAIVELPPRVFRGHVTGCMFDRDKSFVLPEALRCIREIKAFHDDHPKFAVLVVGHTDRTGSDDHNRKLSEERARVVAALLTDDVDAWLGYYRKGHTGKPWGRLEDQYMLATVGDYKGIACGQRSRLWTAAIAAFGGAGNDLDDATRRKLVTTYMKQDRTSLPAGVSIATHGCGERHPLDHGSGEAADRKNRRVEIYLFEDKVEPPPPATCPSGGCAQYAQWGKRSAPLEHLGDAPGVDALLAMEWPTDVVDRLPGDAVVKLTPADMPAIELQAGDAIRELGVARLEFPLPRVPATTRLEASAGGKTVVIWEDRAFGDIGVEVIWSGALDELLPPAPAPDVAGEPVQLTTSADVLPPLPEL